MAENVAIIERRQALAAKLSKTGDDDAYYSGIELYRWWLSRVVLAASRGAEGGGTTAAAGGPR